MFDRYERKQEVYKVKSLFKLLTFIIPLIFGASDVFAQSVSQDNKKTFLRWEVTAQKEQLQINKKGEKVIIQSLDGDFFEQFSANIAKINKVENYHKNFKFIRPDIPGAPYKLEVDIADPAIELFSFYQQDTNSYILDFWVNKDLVTTKNASSRPKEIKVAKLPKIKKPLVKKVQEKNADSIFDVKKIAGTNLLSPNFVSGDENHNGERDFRYGAAFAWDYQALIPPLENDLDIKIKAPDFLYEVKDRTYLDDKKEAHLQLNINFYRKEQWGLMTKSIDLYEKRYGKDKNRELNDFMKATAMIKNAIKEKVKPEFLSHLGPDGEIIPPNEYSKKGIFAAARNVLTNVVDSTQEYQLKKAILRYLIQYARDENDYIQALNYAKSLYVEASEEFDDEMTVFSSRVILNSLANLKQLDKINSFLENKAVIRVLPKQEGIAYISYINLSKDNTDQVIADFKVNENSLTKPFHPSIVFNAAEAYFRQANYKKAIKLYDMFVENYSHFSRSDEARLRLGLSYDLLAMDSKKTLQLYKDSINKSSNPKIRYEAKLRYVGLRVCRNKKQTEEDKETIVFIDGDAAEKGSMDPNLKKLLWLVRLRTLISTNQYDNALAYLTSIPIEHLRRVDQRAFNADGAEIILGIIQDTYLKGNYGRTVKVWETYKEKYESKVAKNPYLTFIVSDSFLKLGLLKSYKRSVSDLMQLKEDHVRRYPLWVEAHKNISLNDYRVELRINELLTEQNFKDLASYLEENKTNKNINYNYYNAIVSYKLKKYNDSVTSVESLLVNPNINNLLTPKQNFMMLETYLESLYEVATPKRFRKNAAALLNDMRRSANLKYHHIIARADYLYLESLFSERSIDYKLLNKKTEEFIKENKDSKYNSRVHYLYAVSLLNTQEEKRGKDVLLKLIEDTTTPEYLKGLARSELSSLELKNRTL